MGIASAQDQGGKRSELTSDPGRNSSQSGKSRFYLETIAIGGKILGIIPILNLVHLFCNLTHDLSWRMFRMY